MIIDRIENHTLYNFGPLWDASFEFIKTLAPEKEEGKTILQGDDLFAGVNCYNTKSRDIAKLETHQTYVDIQLLLSGSEGLEVFPKAGLTVEEPYDSQRDVEFYQVPEKAQAKIILEPGYFIVFFPEDAHMPCLTTDDSPQPVKKVVLKLRADLLL
ncbi:MAG: YhcH/YjgK/YiaL family protein [Verrucomicrobia bacterium]|nr:YhcH/YjgK/YiaL family protein [Verrucomicrobiota bacterium]